MWIDTHSHSRHSPDGQSSVLAMVEQAQRVGLRGLAFSEHAEWMPSDEAYGYWNLDRYFDDLAAAQTAAGPDFKVLAAAEMGNPHAFPYETAAFLTAGAWDCIIGSVHWLSERPVWTRSVFDDCGIEGVYDQYFDELWMLVDQADFDVLGHLDLVRRDSGSLLGYVLPLDAYAGRIRQVLNRLVERGKGLEINTSGLRTGLGDTLPGLQTLRWYRELGGQLLVFGSDAHQANHVGADFAVARRLALEAGFERLADYRRRNVVGFLDL